MSFCDNIQSVFGYAIKGSKSEDDLDCSRSTGACMASKRGSVPAVAPTAAKPLASSLSGEFLQMNNWVIEGSAFNFCLYESQNGR